MPDMQRRPVLVLLVLAMLGNSGLACACSLVAMDARHHTHHGMSGEMAPGEPANASDCHPACGGHSSAALTGKVALFPDFQAEKSFAPVLHYDNTGPVSIAGRTVVRQSLPLRLPVPSPTPVSRRDTMLD
jgi:hypothetical protein